LIRDWSDEGRPSSFFFRPSSGYLGIRLLYFTRVDRPSISLKAGVGLCEIPSDMLVCVLIVLSFEFCLGSF